MLALGLHLSAPGGTSSYQLGRRKQAGNNTAYVGSFKWGESRKLWTEKRSEDFTVTYNEDPAETGNLAWQSGHSCLGFKEASEGLETIWGFVFGGHQVRSIITHGRGWLCSMATAFQLVLRSIFCSCVLKMHSGVLLLLSQFHRGP